MLFDEELLAPLQLSQLQVVLEQKNAITLTETQLKNEPMGTVNYTKSALKGESFINYISNLKLSVNLSVEGASKDDKFALMRSYLKHRNIADIKNLTSTIQMMLFEDKGIGFVDEINVDSLKPILNKEEREEFRALERETLDKVHAFLENILIGMPFYSKQYAASIGKDEIDAGAIVVNTDVFYVGNNVALIILDADFMTEYWGMKPYKEVMPTLFETHLFDPIFQGYSILTLLTTSNNPVLVYMIDTFEGLMEEETKEEDGEKA